MATNGVTEKEVWAVISDLVVEKQDPTIQLIRERLGSGSFATISKHLKSWKLKNDKGTLPPLPEPMLKVAEYYWGHAYKAAESALASEREKLLIQKEEWQTENVAFKNENEKLEIKLHSADRRYNELEQVLERERKLVDEKSKSTARLSEQFAQTRAKLESMTERYNEEKERSARLEKDLLSIAKKK